MKYIILMALVFGLVGCENLQSPADQEAGVDAFNELNEQQAEDLLYMWEEEKLARDVYLAHYDLYGHRVFGNISGSEQKHMEAIGSLLDKYAIQRRVDSEARGVFSFVELQQLYANLIARGRQSQYEAFLVGRDIEVLDIEDLQKRIETSSPDVVAIYENLLQASYRHLNAFNRQL